MTKNFENQILEGDCIEILGGVKEPFVDLVFADPPFNIGYKYDKYHDKKEKEHYLEWTKKWMAGCCNVLKPNGSFYIAIGDTYAANIKVIADELGLVMRNWIIWHYTFGQQTKDKFARAHTHIFYFVKDKNNFTFNDWAVRTPSDRQLIYNDKRANSVGKNPDDVWNCFSRVCGTFKERQGWHPCQMPELLLARIIAASSNEGDCVLDPFNGSGTSAVVAAKYGRKYCGIDISKDYVKKTIERIGKIRNQSSDMEADEIRRLFVEMGIEKTTLLESKKLMDIFAKQFSIRMNNKKEYEVEPIKSVIEEFCVGQKK
ncbi:MAG TPA: site-specific DNA-methyltransferase [Phycisphaerales bacterium]|nr:site-specific DNA-methyltransferase [Phycisphaerales bacterium]